MKKLAITLGLIFIVAQPSWGQTFSIQGVLKDQSGKTLVDGYYAVTFSLYETPSGGSALWSETIPSLRTVNGLFATELGAVTPFGSLAFDRTYWLGVAVEKKAEMPRMKLVTIPYSFSATGVQNRFPSVGNVGIGTTNPESRLAVSGDDSTFVTVQSSGGEAGYALAEDGETRWVIRRMTADTTLRVTEAGVGDALTVRPGGKVGIGTGNPSSILHVGSGDLTVDGDLTSGGDAGGLWVGNRRFIGGDGADKLGIRTGDAWRLTVTPEGKVGIGTTDPAATLEVAGNIKISGGGAVIFPDSTRIASLQTDYAADSVTNPGNLLINADSDANNSGGHQFRTGDTTQMVLTNDGTLGIGTTTPGKRLEVAGDVNFSGELTKNGIPVTTSSWKPVEGTNDIYNEGHIGIGKANPTYTLDVNGSINAQKIYQNGKEVVGSPWRTPIPDKPNYLWYPGHMDVALQSVIFGVGGISRNPSASLHTRMFGGGGWRMGLNTTYNWMELRYVFSNSNTALIGTSSNRWGYAYIMGLYAEQKPSTSDRRAKRNIRPIAGGLEKVMRLNGVRYDINTETHPWYRGQSDEYYANNRTRLTDHLGYVGQELQEVVPEMVVYDEESGYYKVRNYEQLLPVITEAIKDIHAENAALEERIAKLEARVRRLKEEQRK